MILVDAVTSFAAEVEEGVRSENYAWVPAFACIILFTELLKQVLLLKLCSRFTTPFLWIVELLEGDLLSYQRRNKPLLARAWEWNRSGQPTMMAALQAQANQTPSCKQLTSRRGKCIQRNSRRVTRSSGANTKLGRAWFEHGLYMFCALLGVTVFRLLAFHLCFEPVLDVHNVSNGPLLRGVIPFNGMWQRLQTTPAGARVLLIVWPVMKHGLFPLFLQVLWLAQSCLLAMLVWTRNLLRIPGHLQETASLQARLSVQPVPQDTPMHAVKQRSTHPKPAKVASTPSPVPIQKPSVPVKAPVLVKVVQTPVKQVVQPVKPSVPAVAEHVPVKVIQPPSSPSSPTVAAYKPVQKVKPAPSPIKPAARMYEEHMEQCADLVVELRLKDSTPPASTPGAARSAAMHVAKRPKQQLQSFDSVDSVNSTIDTTISPRDEVVQPSTRFESRLARWTGKSSVLENLQPVTPDVPKQDVSSTDSDNASDDASECDEALCVICLTHPRTMGFLHGTTVHACVCPDCAPLVRSGDSCPMCRQPVVAVVSVY